MKKNLPPPSDEPKKLVSAGITDEMRQKLVLHLSSNEPSPNITNDEKGLRCRVPLPLAGKEGAKNDVDWQFPPSVPSRSSNLLITCNVINPEAAKHILEGLQAAEITKLSINSLEPRDREIMYKQAETLGVKIEFTPPKPAPAAELRLETPSPKG